MVKLHTRKMHLAEVQTKSKYKLDSTSKLHVYSGAFRKIQLVEHYSILDVISSVSHKVQLVKI